MNKRLGFVFVALMAVPVDLLGQEKPPASSAPPAQSPPPANPISASEKSFYSFVIAVAGLTVLSPFMLIAALAVKLSSPGPVLYRQRRVGMGGHLFTLYKFRSMYADAEARSGAVWARIGDPRITHVGLWLRKLRLDELPQLWNTRRSFAES